MNSFINKTLTSLVLGLGTYSTLFAASNVIDLDGTDDFVNCGNISAMNGLSQFTVEAYVKWDVLGYLDTIFAKRDGHNDKIQISLGNPGNEDDILIQIGKNGTLCEATTANIFTTGVCYHVAVVFDGTQGANSDRLKFYLNGVQQTLSFSGTLPTTSDSPNSAPVIIGSENTTATVTPLNGTLDEVRFWTTARTSSDIVANMGFVLAGNEAGLLGYWNFNDGTANDVTSNNYDGTLTNGATITSSTCGNDTPLSVSLSHFALKNTENSIQLFWTTESETNNLGFKVLRSIGDMENFRTVATYENNPNLKGQGTSATPTNYTWNDTEVEFGKTYFYYLVDVDFDLLETHNTDRTLSGTLTLDAENNGTKFVYELKQNFPNPFNPSTTISYTIAKQKNVKLEIYNVKGELVRTLVNEKQNEGSHSSVWNGKDASGNAVSSGVYFYKLTAGNFVETKKMLLVK